MRSWLRSSGSRPNLRRGWAGLGRYLCPNGAGSCATAGPRRLPAIVRRGTGGRRGGRNGTNTRRPGSVTGRRRGTGRSAGRGAATATPARRCLCGTASRTGPGTGGVGYTAGSRLARAPRKAVRDSRRQADAERRRGGTRRPTSGPPGSPPEGGSREGMRREGIRAEKQAGGLPPCLPQGEADVAQQGDDGFVKRCA
jgi:hypothetical protein